MSQRMNITLTDELYNALARLSKERGVPMVYLIREGAALYLDRSARVKVKDIHPAWGGPRESQETDENEQE